MSSGRGRNPIRTAAAAARNNTNKRIPLPLPVVVRRLIEDDLAAHQAVIDDHDDRLSDECRFYRLSLVC